MDSALGLGNDAADAPGGKRSTPAAGPAERPERELAELAEAAEPRRRRLLLNPLFKSQSSLGGIRSYDQQLAAESGRLAAQPAEDDVEGNESWDTLERACVEAMSRFTTNAPTVVS